MNPMLLLFEASTGSFDIAQAMEFATTGFTKIMDILVKYPILYAPLVCGIVMSVGGMIFALAKKAGKR